MANLLETSVIALHHVGEKSGETFTGSFHCFRRLTHRLELARDRLSRELLGPNPEGASEDSRLRAEILAELKVAFSIVPDWFAQSDWGMDLYDNTLIVKLYEEILKIRKAAIDELQKKSDQAGVELKKLAEADKVK
jgi:hypothetical protein